MIEHDRAVTRQMLIELDRALLGLADQLLASRRLRSISGRPRRSSPSCSIRSNANSTTSRPRRRLRSAWKSGVPSSRAITALAVDQERLRLDAQRGINDGRKAVAQS